jgi:hypothetical protein
MPAQPYFSPPRALFEDGCPDSANMARRRVDNPAVMGSAAFGMIRGFGMSLRHGPRLNLEDPKVKAELCELRQLMADCLDRMDALSLNDLAPHLDLALALFDEGLSGRDPPSAAPDLLQ